MSDSSYNRGKPRPRILVADDDKVSRLKVRHILEADVGADVLLAEDGEQAWEIFLADENIHFIISDWIMPGCNGPELCQRVRARTGRPYTYFILATAKSEEQDLVDGLALGADDYIRKPIHGSELQARVNAGLRMVELERSLAQRNTELERALKAAGQMQQEMLPNPALLEKIRHRVGLDVVYDYHACESLGGDVLGLTEHEEGVITLMLGDVSGHGIPASLAAVGLSAFFQTQTSITSDPRELVLRAHRFCASEFPVGVYATAVVLRLEAHTRKVQGVVAGHPPLLHLRGDKIVQKFSAGIPPLGLFPEPPDELSGFELQLEYGDRLIAYTDGIVETRNAAGEMYSDEHLTKSLTTAAGATLAQMLKRVLADVVAWRGSDSSPEDDITLLALQFNQPT